MRRRVVFPLLYAALLFATLEGGLRLVLAFPAVKWRLLTEEDELYWRELWLDRREKVPGRDGYYPFDRYDATKGWISKPRLRGFRAAGGWMLSTNDLGLRGVRDHPVPKPTARKRILILGDSFTFGDGVGDDETYTHHLQEMLPETEILNFGVHGYAHDQMAILLREHGLPSSPDVVVLGFVHMDMSRNLLSFRDFAKPRFRLVDGALRLENSPVPTPESAERWDFARLRTLGYARLAWARVRRAVGFSRRDEEIAITAAILGEMATAIRANGARPLYVFLPTGAEMNDAALGDAHERDFLDVCDEVREAECDSLLPRLRARTREGRRFEATGHWLPAEHRLVAEELREVLVERGAAPE